MSKTFSMTTMLEVFFLDLQAICGGPMKPFFPTAHAIKRPPGPASHSPTGSSPPADEGPDRGSFCPFLLSITTEARGLRLSVNGLWRQM